MWQTRRQFLKTTAAGGATVLISRLVPFDAPTEAGAAAMDPPDGWSGAAGRARYRIDGLAKVTGQRIYARDFLPEDLPGWPAEYRHALVLCAPFNDHVFAGIDLDALPRDGRPAVVVTAEDLAGDGIGVAEDEYPAGKYLVKRGHRPDYLGKPVGILLFDDRAAFTQARKILAHDRKGVRAGERVDVPAPTDYPSTSLIHVVTHDGQRTFARTIDGPVQGVESSSDAGGAEAMRYVNEITKLFETEPWDLYSRTYGTQVVDPMFMEPENGLAWLDRETKTLEFLVGTQSPGSDAGAVEAILAPSTLGVESAHLYAAYPGGAFGGRDTSMLCLYLGLAAAYSDKPIRIQHDRFQQFAQGNKRHASRIELAMGLEPDGTFRAIRNRTVLNGGGRINVSSYVADTAAILGAGCYRFRWADIWSRPQHTQSLVGAAMRGFGALQATYALESLVDEIALARRVDPIDLRRQNVLGPDDSIVTGVPAAPPGVEAMLDRAQAHELWTNRDAERVRSESSGHAYGVGFALAIKNYGTGADASNAAVSVGPDGTIVLTTSAVDMGQGLATALAVSTGSHLGRNADEIVTGEIRAFDALQQVADLEMHADDPRWTPSVGTSTKASSGSSRWVHAVEQASAILLEAGILPAARELWGGDAHALDARSVRWVSGALSADGFTPIPLAALARRMHERGLVVATMVHAFFSARWISAEYAVDGSRRRWEIDGLAVRRGHAPEWDLIDRRDADLFTVQSSYDRGGMALGAAAALVAVEVERATGEIRVVQGVHLAAPGKMIVPALVEGQMDGCWAMGVGQVLLEDIPADASGGSSGTWNLNRYHVPLARDCAIHATEKIILPPEGPDAPARGMGEVPLNCVPPAIANAVAHATGARLRDLPITAEKVRAVWS